MLVWGRQGPGFVEAAQPGERGRAAIVKPYDQ